MPKIVILILLSIILTSCSITQINKDICNAQCAGLKYQDYCIARCMSR